VRCPRTSDKPPSVTWIELKANEFNDGDIAKRFIAATNESRSIDLRLFENQTVIERRKVLNDDTASAALITRRVANSPTGNLGRI